MTDSGTNYGNPASVRMAHPMLIPQPWIEEEMASLDCFRKWRCPNVIRRLLDAGIHAVFSARAILTA